jgi:hypothetical protein
MLYNIEVMYYLNPHQGLAEAPSSQKVISKALLDASVQPNNWYVSTCHLHCFYTSEHPNKEYAVIQGNEIGEEIIRHLVASGVFQFEKNRYGRASHLMRVEAKPQKIDPESNDHDLLDQPHGIVEPLPRPVLINQWMALSIALESCRTDCWVASDLITGINQVRLHALLRLNEAERIRLKEIVRQLSTQKKHSKTDANRALLQISSILDDEEGDPLIRTIAKRLSGA